MLFGIPDEDTAGLKLKVETLLGDWFSSEEAEIFLQCQFAFYDDERWRIDQPPLALGEKYRRLSFELATKKFLVVIFSPIEDDKITKCLSSFLQSGPVFLETAKEGLRQAVGFAHPIILTERAAAGWGLTRKGYKLEKGFVSCP